MRGAYLLAILAFAIPARAQSAWNFTLTDDPALCHTFCNTTGSGMFTASPTLFQNIQGSGYPLLSLTGTLNGAALSLAPVPTSQPVQGIGNLFYLPSLPVGWFAPWYLNTTNGIYILSQTDVNHPGTGQSLIGPGLSAPVSFTVTPYVAPVPTAPAPKAPPIPTFSSRPPVLSSTNSGPVTFQRASAPVVRHQPVVVEVSVISAIATVVAIYEWRRHRTHADAYPAGRF